VTLFPGCPMANRFVFTTRNDLSRNYYHISLAIPILRHFNEI
jgi:hypothetical protein